MSYELFMRIFVLNFQHLIIKTEHFIILIPMIDKFCQNQFCLKISVFSLIFNLLLLTPPKYQIDSLSFQKRYYLRKSKHFYCPKT
ncbi:Uncharacterized protein FWK35_00019257 [Aphis craccivora]|uniref:Uncharacterized protein n=1 Tax=Aphis craccivora TaxID=307492 RepID=A0A6G0Y0R1_APHCR|nr:Uncharacterized protein FWK35_00019257 [Aphis craccivora]